MKKDNETQLVFLGKDGDRAAINQLFTHYQHRVLRLIGCVLNDPDEIQDIAQEAFFRAFRALPQFRGESSFQTWLCRIVLNTVGTHVASRCRRPLVVDIDVDDAELIDGLERLRREDGPVATLCRDQLSREIRRAIWALPEELRGAIALRELGGKTYKQIARITRCPVGTVRSRIFRAREAIHKRIRPILDP